MQRVEIHLHIDSLVARHYVLRAGERPLSFHGGFSQTDASNGWKQVLEFGADTEAEIDAEKAKAVEGAKQYWDDLLRQCSEVRVVQDGIHYVAHPVETGIGYGGLLHRIHWLDARLAPTVCTLSCQGRIPLWMRGRLPDNAHITTLN